MKKLAQYFVLMAILLFIFEATFRVLGFKPYYFEPFSIVSEPAFCLIPHATLGLSLNPGSYEVTINEGLHYKVTHTSDSLRKTTATPRPASAPRMDFHGCSFTYGMGVDDQDAYPWLVQEQLDSFQIRTMAMPGHGILQALILLKEQERKGELPNVVVLNYAAFHDQRNLLDLQYRKHLHYGFERSNTEIKVLFQSARFPYAELSPEGKLRIAWENWDAIYHNWPGRKSFAAVNFLQSAADQIRDQLNQGPAVSETIIDEIQTICQRNEVQFILTGITNDPETKSILAKASEKKINTLLFDIDLQNEQFNNQPYDSHPNARAHLAFAQRFLDHFE